MPCPLAVYNRKPPDENGKIVTCTYLCKAEEETNAPDKPQNLSSVFSYYWSTRWAWVAAFDTALYEFGKKKKKELFYQSAVMKSR